MGIWVKAIANHRYGGGAKFGLMPRKVGDRYEVAGQDALALVTAMKWAEKEEETPPPVKKEPPKPKETEEPKVMVKRGKRTYMTKVLTALSPFEAEPPAPADTDDR